MVGKRKRNNSCGHQTEIRRQSDTKKMVGPRDKEKWRNELNQRVKALVAVNTTRTEFWACGLEEKYHHLLAALRSLGSQASHEVPT